MKSGRPARGRSGMPAYIKDGKFHYRIDVSGLPHLNLTLLIDGDDYGICVPETAGESPEVCLPDLPRDSRRVLELFAWQTAQRVMFPSLQPNATVGEALASASWALSYETARANGANEVDAASYADSTSAL